MQQINTGIVGFGLSGSVFHAPLLAAMPEFKITAIVSSRPDAVAAKYPQATVVDSLDKLLATNVELVVVAVPNTLHFDYCRRALDKGKHVVVEKPFCPTVGEGKLLIKLAQEKKLTLSVFHNRRWDGDFLTVKKLIAEGTLGEVMVFESHFDRYRPEVDRRWKEVEEIGGGNFFDLGSHLIDQALELFGEPDDYCVDLATQRPHATNDDYFHLLMKYGQRRVIIHGGTITPRPAPRFRIHGMLQGYLKHGLDPQEGMLKQGMKPGDRGWAEEDKAAYGVLTRIEAGLQISEPLVTTNGCYEAYYRGIFASIRHGKEAPVTAASALKVIEIIERARENPLLRRP